MKNKLFQKTIVILIGVLLPSFVAAQTPRLEVTFTPDPLFSEASILPGDIVSGTVEVTNNSGENQTVITEAINVSDPSSLSEQMSLAIHDAGATVFYNESNGTFKDFLTGGVFNLTDPLPDGESVTYTFYVSFENIDDNSLQLAQLGFDLCVGFKDEITGMNCGDTVVSGEDNLPDGEVGTGGDPSTSSGQAGTTSPGTSNSGGGGGNPNTPALQIFNETVESVDDVAGTAVISWDTNLYSTSQIVYGLASDGPFSLSGTATNFGYPFATVEDPFKVINHSVILSGLTPGATYNFRVVSRASPPTVSYEYEFKVEKKEPTEIPNPFAPLTPTNTDAPSDTNLIISTPNTGGSGSLAIADPEPSDQQENATSTDDDRRDELEELVNSLGNEPIRNTGESPASPEATQDEGEAFTAAAFLSNFFTAETNMCLAHIVIALVLIALIYMLWTRIVHRDADLRERKIILYALLTSGIVISALLQTWCTVIALVVALALYVAQNMLKKSKKQTNVGQYPT